MTTLIISEKPSTSERIATALADEKPAKKTYGKIPYYELSHSGEKIVVGCAVGHLFTLAQKDKKGWTYPVFDVSWVPSYTASKSAIFSKKYFELLKKLAKMADSYVNGCDLDVEGELIFRNILRFICHKEDAKRMRFSTLTKEDLVKAYDNLSPHIDFGLAEAGEARHFLDWFFGINLSRALTLSLKEGGGYKTLSTGRVQGPVLDILEKRQREIEAFKPKPFWQIQLIGLIEGEKITALHIKGNFWKKEEALGILERCRGKPATVVKIQKREQKLPSPFPFDLTSLQTESYANFGFTPKQTLDVAQSLYEKALISYPRTASQKLPAKLGYKNILTNLAKQKNYSEPCKKLLKKPRLKPNEGPKTDPAHPSIFPTGNKPQGLNSYQTKLYDLIVKRFLAVFADPAVRETMKVLIEINKERFLAQGARTLMANWTDFYRPYARFKEAPLPKIEEGQSVGVEKLEILEKETKPPKRYTPASILKEMEKLGLGTKGTRALILQNLYDRGYIRERALVVTPLGQAVVTALEKYSPEIVSVELTKRFEEEMESIQAGKKKMEEALKDAEETLRKILAGFKKHEREIGLALLKGVKEFLREESIVGKCTCGGELVIKFSRAKKRFVACTKYPKCTETFSLPQKGNLTILSEKCQKCGLNIILVKDFKKRPWKLCVRCGFVKG